MPSISSCCIHFFFFFSKMRDTECNCRFGHVGAAVLHLCDATCKTQESKTSEFNRNFFCSHLASRWEHFFPLSLCFANTLIMIVKFSPRGETCSFASLLFCLSQDSHEKIAPLCGFVVETMLLATREQANIRITWRPAGPFGHREGCRNVSARSSPAH